MKDRSRGLIYDSSFRTRRFFLPYPSLLTDRRACAGVSVVERVDLVFDFGREADAVEAVAAQALHGVADLADLAHARVRVAVLDVDERLRLDAFDRVVRIVGNVARRVLDEVVGRVEAAADDEGARGGEEVGALGFGHVEVDGLEQPAAD